MKIKLIAILVFVSTALFAGNPQKTAILPDTIFTPDEVQMALAAFYLFCISPEVNIDGDSYYYEIDSNNHITVIIIGTIFQPCAGGGSISGFTHFYNLGLLPEGVYTAQMHLVGPNATFPPPPGQFGPPVGSLINFNVSSSPHAIPSINIFSIILLGVIIMFLTFHKKLKKKSYKVVMFSLLAFSINGDTKVFHILLSADNSSPTALQVVSQANVSPPPPSFLLSSFNTNPPSGVGYLLNDRLEEGNLLSLITQHPNWSLSKLYRYLVITYPDTVDEVSILNSFEADSSIEKASYTSNIEIVNSASYQENNLKSKKPSQNKGVSSFLNDLNINSAWELSEGMGYIGAMDNGAQLDHPALSPFDENDNYLGGNLLEAFFAIDFAGHDMNIDENQPINTNGATALEACDLADGLDDNFATTKFVGHGTHISGILAGKSATFKGICKNCGLSMMKIFNNDFCLDFLNPPQLFPIGTNATTISAMEILATLGVGVINWSGGIVQTNFAGTEITNNEFFCPDASGYCDALDFIKEQNIVMSSSAGNFRASLQFPASEVSTVAVGGLNQVVSNVGQLQFWNESPNGGDLLDFNNSTTCPRTPPFNECGSNISAAPINQKLDTMTQAKSVFSIFYQGGQWAPDLDCVDDVDVNNADGFGTCTGTSMSAPQVSAILQLMRSTNPLLPNGTYNPSLNTGIINVLNSTSSRSINGQGVSDFFGYGLPNARLALETILGKSNSIQVKTRLTPMFSVVSLSANNNAYTPFPQVAMAYQFSEIHTYIPDTSKPLVNEFTEFWYDTVNLTFPAPRAEFYVFTTNNNPFSGVKDLVPLRRMEKTVSGNRNDTYAVSDAEIQSFHDDDYNYAGIEGYILPTCSPMPACRPVGAITLYRDESDNLNHKLVPTNIVPANSVLLGFVYLNFDTDNDGLIDGQERILGTNVNLKDTDGDGIDDGVEYPPAGVPVSDPLIDEAGVIFKDGFED